MAAGHWKLYDIAKVYLMDGTLDLNSNTLKMALFASTSNCNTLSGNVKFGDLTNELATANGYTAGGTTLSGLSVTNASGTTTFTSGNASWTATGGSITARFAVIYASGTLNSIVNPILCVVLLDTTPADVTATTGNPFTVQIAGGGILQLSGATTD